MKFGVEGSAVHDNMLSDTINIKPPLLLLLLLTKTTRWRHSALQYDTVAMCPLAALTAPTETTSLRRLVAIATAGSRSRALPVARLISGATPEVTLRAAHEERSTS